MKDSKFMSLLYVSMAGIPVLMIIYLVATALAIAVAQLASLILIVIGLLVFGIIGFFDVYYSRPKMNPANVSMENGETTRVDADRTEGSRKVTFTVKRFDSTDAKFHEDTYVTNADRYSTVLSSLLDIKEKGDGTLSMRYSCRMGICGSCGMVVNGKPVLACECNVLNNLKDDEIKVEPMQAHPLLKDLVTDFDDFFEKHASAKPGLFRQNSREKYDAKRMYIQSKKQLDKFLPYSYCIMCGLCMDACPVANTNTEFAGPQALSQVYRYLQDSRDQKREIRLQDIDVISGAWGCEFAGSCSEVCPKGVDPASAIQLLKAEIMKDAISKGKEVD